MGQKIGKATLLDVVIPFTNLPRRAVLHIWQVFNNIADGFGVGEEELLEILVDLKDELNVSKISMTERIKSLFRCFDTDENGLIDALEFFSTIAILSGMKKIAIMEFILSVYDFDGTESLSMDEVILALKSVAQGLCKVQSNLVLDQREKVLIAKEELIEQLVSTVFSNQLQTIDVDEGVRLNIKVLGTLLVAHPDINYWYTFFSNPTQQDLPSYHLTEYDRDFATENPKVQRESGQLQAIEWDVRCESAAAASEGLDNPWLSSVAMLTPVEYSTATITHESPNCYISPEWVYGYQAEKCKSNLHYNFKGDLVYNISRFVVIYSIKLHEQQIFTGHTEEILCLAMHPNRQIVVSGEVGPDPKVLLWHSESHKILYCAKGYHKNGITQLGFSPDGKILVSVGNDDSHSVSVVRWQDKQVLFNSPVSAGACYACCVPLGDTIVVGGDSYVYFWSRYSEGYRRRTGNFSRFTKLQPITALVAVHESENVISGSASGELLLWVDINCVRNVQAHRGTLNTLYSCAHGVLSGGFDQRVRMWSPLLEPSFTFDISNYGINPIVRSLCMAADGTSILVGTKGSNIYEISAIDGSDLRGGPVGLGHSFGQLHAVCSHPSKFEFITVGTDRTMRVYDMNTNSQLKIITFDGEAKAVTYNALGDVIVVGFAGDPSLSAKTGAFVVISEEDLVVVHEARDSRSPVSAVVFSPEGETLAVGCADGSIYLYAVHDEYEMVGKCERHTAAITHLDFSVDGEWLRSNSADKQLYFFSADDASYQSNVSSMRDVQWASFNCIYSWHVKFTHRDPYAKDIITCCHTPPFDAEPVREKYVACGTKLGYLRLYSFPCAVDGAECHRYPAHCCEVAGAKHSFDGKRLISAGLDDRCIIQWACTTYDTNPDVLRLEDLPEDSDLQLEVRTGSQLQDKFMPPNSACTIGVLNSIAGDSAVIAATPENDIWLTSVVEPTVLPIIRTEVPEMSLLIEHVYGYESQTLRNSVRYANDDEIVYTAATMGLVLNTRNKSQRVYKFHSDAITAFASNKDGTLVATAQMGHAPTLSIWNTASMNSEFVLPDMQLNAIACVAFSPNSEYIAVVNMDTHHTISVYDWKAGICVCKAYGGDNHLLGIRFREVDGNLGFVTFGIRELRFWKNVTCRFPSSRRANFGEIGAVQNYLCCEIFAGHSVVGCADGNLYVFKDHNLRHAVKAHNGAVFAMHASEGTSQRTLVTGGKDGAVRLWSADHSCIKEFAIDALINTHNPIVRSVAFNSRGSHIVVGTRASEIIEISIIDGKVRSSGNSSSGETTAASKTLVDGHGARQLRGLTAHPTKEECATAGDDAAVRIWDCKNFQQIKSIKMDTASRAITYSPDGKFLALGYGNGKRTKGKLAAKEGSFVIMKTTDFKIVHEAKDSNNAITVVKYSADMKTFVTGSEDNNIYIYNVKEQYSRRATVRCHQAPLAFIDFSSEGHFFVSVDVTRTVCFTEAASGVTIPTPEALRDERWLTSSSPVSWAVRGFWETVPAGEYPLVSQKSWGGLLLASGGTGGCITVSHNPYPRRAGFLRCSGHAGAVSGLAWLAGDGALLSIGDDDHVLIQWKCAYDATRESGDEGGRSCDDSEIDIDGGHEIQKQSGAKQQQQKQELSVVNRNENTTSVEAKDAEQQATSLQQPWYSMIAAPSNPLPEDTTAPDAALSLDFVHGARLGDCRKLMRYNENGCIIYAAASLAIIFDRNIVSQLFYTEHKGAIISLDIDTSGRVAATGDLGFSPEIHVWDAKTGAVLSKFEHLHRGGVSCLSFSATAQYLVSLGQDVQNSIAICYSPTGRWNDGYHICSTAVSSAKMLWCLHTASCSDFPIVVGGAAGNVFFFRVVRGAAERVKGVYGKRYKIQPQLCAIEGAVVMADGEQTQQAMICGTVTGYIYLFVQSKVVNRMSAHDAPINAICKARKNFLTAGKDGRVKLWSPEFKLLYNFNILAFQPRAIHPSCHNIACNPTGTSFVVGMRSGEVFEVSLQSHSYLLLEDGHSCGEIHALAVNPQNSDEYATAGDDGMVMVWSLRRRYCLRKARIEAPCRALAWSPDGEQIAAGVGTGNNGANSSKDGAFMVLDARSLEVIREERKAKQHITDVKYAPSQETIALASSDGRVYIHGTKKFELKKVVAMPSKTCSVTSIDYSTSSTILRVSTSFKQLYYYSLDDEDFIGNLAMVRDIDWDAPSCPFSWQTQGVFRQRSDDVMVSAVSVHPSGQFIACSYQNGDVRLYRYPSQIEQAEFLRIPGVATEATRLCFSADGSFLILLDSKTRAILQFAVRQTAARGFSDDSAAADSSIMTISTRAITK